MLVIDSPAFVSLTDCVRVATGEQIAGYKTVYEHNFTFQTVKGAGHMVPQYQPQRALDLFSRFIGAVEDPDALPTPTPPAVAPVPSPAPSLPTTHRAPAVGRNPLGVRPQAIRSALPVMSELCLTRLVVFAGPRSSRRGHRAAWMGQVTD